MTLEDCIAAVADLGADGVEILGEQMMPGFPSPPAKFIDQWFGWMEKYGTRPTAYDGFLDTKLYKNRSLTEAECRRHDGTGHPVGQPPGIQRAAVTTPRDVIAKSLPYAERLDVRIGIEVHSSWSLKSAWIDEFMEFAEKLNTPYFGIIPDMGIFVKRLPPVVLGWYVRHGAQEPVVRYIAEAYAARQEKEQTMADVVKMCGNEMDQRLYEMAFHFIYDDPNWLTKYIPRMLHVHAKFYEMTPECVEPSIPYEEIVPILSQGGYADYLSSEYAGQRHIQDMGEVDSVEQVRRQHAMFDRLMGS